MAYHFGLKILEGKKGLNLTREKYAFINNKSSVHSGKLYTDEWCEKHLKNCLENFDLNMKYFSLLNHTEFCSEIQNFLESNNDFIEIDDLNLYDGKAGYYIMVLDDYCQVYIGTTGDIKKRIRQHWSTSKPFDRLIFGTVDSSKLSIDSFRALDTTRIYAYKTNETFTLEDEFINQFSDKFVCNRLAGGKITGALNVFESIIMIKNRNLK